MTIVVLRQQWRGLAWKFEPQHREFTVEWDNGWQHFFPSKHHHTFKHVKASKEGESIHLSSSWLSLCPETRVYHTFNIGNLPVLWWAINIMTIAFIVSDSLKPPWSITCKEAISHLALGFSCTNSWLLRASTSTMYGTSLQTLFYKHISFKMIGFHTFCDRVLIWVNDSPTSYSLPSPVYLNLCNTIFSPGFTSCVYYFLPYYIAPTWPPFFFLPPDLYKHSKLNMDI